MMHLCGCCEVDCAGGYSAKNNAGWWVDFSGGFSYLSPEYQRRFCDQFEGFQFGNPSQYIGVDTLQFLPSLEPLRDSILVQGPGAVNWTTCGWQNYVGHVDRWQTFSGSAAANAFVGTFYNCMPENKLISRTPIDYRSWQLANAEQSLTSVLNGDSNGRGTWYGEEPPDPTTLEHYCQNDHPEGIGENNLNWKFTDRLLGWHVSVSHTGGTGEYEGKQRLEVQLRMIPYTINNEWWHSRWPHDQSPDEYPFISPTSGFYPEYYDARSNWHEQEVGDGSRIWIDVSSFRETFFEPQVVGRYNQLFLSEDVLIRQCQEQTLLNGRAGSYAFIGTSNTVDDHYRIWRSDWLDGEQIDGVTPHILHFVEPGTPELDWWYWLGLVNLPETLTLTPIGVDELIDITGEEPQEVPA